MKTAFVFAGGGSLGAIQVGMLRALVDHGVQPDMIVGASVGAINGAYLAAAPTREGIGKLERIWWGLRRSDVFPIDYGTLIGFIWSRDHLVSLRGLRRLIDRHLPYRNLEQAAVPLHVVTTDLLSGETVTLSNGSAADAIIASCAIPAAFAPVRLGRRCLVDGAVANNAPISIAARLGATRIILLPTGFPCALESPPRGATATILHALNLIIARQLVSDLESLRMTIEIVTIPPPCPLPRSPYDFTRTEELIEDAAASVTRWLSERGLEAGVIPDALRPHFHPQNHERESSSAARRRETSPSSSTAVPQGAA